MGKETGGEDPHLNDHPKGNWFGGVSPADSFHNKMPRPLGITLLYGQFLPPACQCPVSASRLPYYPKCKPLSCPPLLYLSHLSGPVIQSRWGNPVSPLHPECPPLPQLNIAGSCCWFIQAHLKVTPLTVKRWLTLNCRGSCSCPFLLHEFNPWVCGL